MADLPSRQIKKYLLLLLADEIILLPSPDFFMYTHAILILKQ